jgi:hypothetical protein
MWEKELLLLLRPPGLLRLTIRSVAVRMKTRIRHTEVAASSIVTAPINCLVLKSAYTTTRKVLENECEYQEIRQ